MTDGRPALLIALLLWAGCSGGSEDPPPAGATSDTLVLERGAEIGEVTGDERYQFGHVAGVTADGSGRIYVADRMGSFVRVYSPDGVFLRQIGREGAGPGEFTHPSDLFLDPSGRLWVRDSRRATVFMPRSPDAIPDSVVETRPFSGYTNWTSTARSRLIDDLYYYPGYAFRQGEPDRYFYFAYDRDGPTGDTVRVPPYETLGGSRSAYYMITAGSGRMVRGLNRAPFEPRAGWELTEEGTILGGSGESSIVETDRNGDTLRVIRIPGRRAVATTERADSAAALRARVDSLPVPLRDVQGVSELVRAGVLPDTVPGFLAVHTSTEGEVWVRRWPPEGSGGSHFDVFTRNGELAGRVRIPQDLLFEPPPFIGGERIIGVVQDPVTDVHKVVLYHYPTTYGGAEHED